MGRYLLFSNITNFLRNIWSNGASNGTQNYLEETRSGKNTITIYWLDVVLCYS